MPALVNLNFGGDDGIRPRGPLACPPPRKRARYSSPFLRRRQQQLASEAVSLDSLPDECLFEVLRRLPGDAERSNSACVSKRWLALLSSIRSSELSMSRKAAGKPLPDLNMEVEDEAEGFGWLTRCFEDSEVTDVRVAAAAVCTAGRGGLGKLVVRGSHPTRGLTDFGLSAVARCCPSLKVVSLCKVPRVTDTGLAELAAGCPMLEKLDLCDCPLITGKGLRAVAEKCHNLMTLSLDNCAGIGNEGLLDIGGFCPKLHTITIKDCPLIGDQGISSLMSSASSSLSKLKLQTLGITDFALACVGHYGKAITELQLFGLGQVAERGFWCMGNAMNLRKLKLLVVTTCRGATDVGLAAVAKGCPSLKQLCLRGCLYLSDLGLQGVFDSAPALENLYMEDCYRITLVGILRSLLNTNAKLKTLALIKCLGVRDLKACPTVLPVCKSLKSLTIRDCPGFTSASLAVVGKICPGLTHLDLSGLSGVTDAGLIPVIENSEEGLIKVSLKGSVNMTDAAITSLLKEHGDTLQVLNLDGCSKLTDRVLLAVSEHCTVLEELDMSTANITDYGVALLASARHLSIRILSFAGCAKVTPRSLPLLSNMGPSLVGLNLQKCTLIQAHGTTSLESKMWWCDILS